MTDPALPALVALLLPASAFLLLAVVAPLRRSGRPAAYLSVLFAAGALVSALDSLRVTSASGGYSAWLWPWIPTEAGPLTSVGVLADGDSALMLVLVALVSFLVQVYSLGYLSDESAPSLGRYYTYQSLFAFSMMGLVLAPNFVQLFIGWELVGLCSYLLIGYWYPRPEAARAAVKAFWITKAGDVGFLIGIVLLWRQAGTFDFLELLNITDTGAMPLAGLGIITFCIYLGASGKSAQFPFHVWLPDAMEGPTPVSALIHAATMVTAGVYLLTRTVWLFRLTPDVMQVIAWNGAFTALLAAVLACVQTDIKRVLAYSTVSQLGYMMAAIGAGFASAGFLHLLTNDIFQMGGLGRKMPQTAIVFVVGTLSLAGIPFFAGFFSKEEILGATLAGGFLGPFAMLLLGAFLTAFYMFRVVFITFAGTPAHGPEHHAHDAPLSMALPLWILALLSLGLGTLFAFWHPRAEFEELHWLTPTAVLVALAGIALAYVVYQRRLLSADALAHAFAPIRAAALRRFWLDDLFAFVYRGLMLTLSRLVGWIDRYLVDGVLNVLSAWTLMSGDRLRHLQSGRAQDYVYGIALGVLLIMLWTRWPR